MKKSRQELEKQCAEAKTKVEQYQHEGQRIENRIRYYQQGDRKKRNHRLITRGAAVESIVPEVRGMSERALPFIRSRAATKRGTTVLSLTTAYRRQGLK